MNRAAARPRVLIVGAGLAGTATAIRLLCFARRPLEIVLLERRADYRCAGIAYHHDGNPWEHVFNIQAGRMSLFREDVFDFIRWANREADRTAWPAPWREAQFTEHGPAPRRILQDYLVDRLAQARREAGDGIDLVEADGEALDIRLHPAGAEVTVRSSPRAESAEVESTEVESAGPGTRVLHAEQVILATGLELREPPFATAVTGHPSYVRNPYSADGIRKLEQLPPEATVAIVGSVLSAYDSAALLLRRGHTGTIHLISRSGTLFRAYPEDHQHAVVRLPAPEKLLEPFRDPEEFIARIRDAWEQAKATAAHEHPGLTPAVLTERVAKAWEPHLPAIIEQIPSRDLKHLLNRYATPVAALRVNAMRYTISVIERAMQGESTGDTGDNGNTDGTVRLVVGGVETITPARTAPARLHVTVDDGDPQPRVIEADLVVSNFSREPDYTRVEAHLWRNLVARGTAVPHARTGRGIEVDEHGVLLDATGHRAGPLTAVGVLREGDEIVRNGRTGAFAFNLAAIKNQSIAVAAHVLEQLDLRADGFEHTLAEQHGHLGNVEQAAEADFEQAVVLEVRRLAMRTREQRLSLDEQLATRIRTLTDLRLLPLEAPQSDRLLRAAVNRAAVARLTDVSVTPLALRRQLGLANADDPED